MKHFNYQPQRTGLLASQILKEKQLRVLRNGRNTAAIRDLMTSTIAEFKAKELRYSDRGDFTRCYRGGF